MALQIKQDFDYQNGGYWLWSVWIDGEKEEVALIESVRYTLHSSYSPPVRTVTDQASNFSLMEKAYEEFTLYAMVTFQDGHQEHLEHDLKFAKIRIKNDCWLQEDGLWHWELSIEGDEAELKEIESVSYLLPDSEQISEDQDSGFIISGKNSGLIRIGIEVRFCDGRCFQFEETLQLSDRLADYTSEEKAGILDNAKALLTFPDIKVESNIIEAASIPPLAPDYVAAFPSAGDIPSVSEAGTNEPLTEAAALLKEKVFAAELSEADDTVTEPSNQPQQTKPPFLESIFEQRLQAVGGSEPSAPSVETVLDIKRLFDNQLFPSSVDELRKYIVVLKGSLAYGLARKLLTAAQHKPEWQEQATWICQQLALCTYKDEELPPKSRFEQALSILEGIGLRNRDNIDSETLALGGAIYKRKWQTSGQLEDLHESLFFYQAAYERNPVQDMGYGGINAAFIMDLLADRLKAIAARNNAQAAESERLQRLSMELRQRMATEIPLLAKHKANEQAQAPDYWDKQYWYLVTLAEIHFGLKNYVEARSWLVKARTINAREWEKETLFKQLLQIARLHGIAYPEEADNPSTWHHPAWQALTEILGDNTGRALGTGRGKVGLALSGGGFRASFFHLGVMARLAEIDALRSVEVLSTVSGGSILGAHYYLEVQNLLQTKSDSKITRDDYIELVQRVQKDFLQGVQSNIRMQAFTDLRDSLRMLFSKTYTRSHRFGELYESELYRRVQDGKVKDEPRNMQDLLVKPEPSPKDEPNPQAFKPRFYNWRRRTKVPTLLLNSTSLNSGHNWQFTASWMGESPGLVGGEVDVNQRYRRVYYKDTPTAELQKYRLGHAVAASACVPGLFDPLSISGLFDGQTVRLVDGGVHDNQGVAGLLDENCTLILCSDASGQMSDVHNPTDDPAGVLMRTSSILQDRVREAEYLDLRSRLDSRALDGLFFVHTKKELEEAPLDWINCKDPLPPVPPSPDNCTSYGIDRDLQKKIAAIRTDLDAFTEVEAYALMASGYRMAKREFNVLQQQHLKSGRPGTWGGYDIEAPGKSWPFSPMEPLLEQAPGANPQRNDLGLQLQVANMTFFRALGLIPSIQLLTIVLGGLVLIDLTGLLAGAWSTTAFNMNWGTLFIAVIALLISLFAPAVKWLFPKEEARSILIKGSISLVGYVVSKLQIKLIDPLFLARGNLERLLGLKLPKQPDEQEPTSVNKK